MAIEVSAAPARSARQGCEPPPASHGRCRASSTAAKSRRRTSSSTTRHWPQSEERGFHASILTLSLDGEKQQVLLRDLQMHPCELQVMHIDFQRVSKDKKIHMKVPLHFVNAEIAPGVKAAAALVSHVLNELDIICLPDDLPVIIEVDLSQPADRATRSIFRT